MVEASSKRKVLPGKRADVLDAVGWIPVDGQTHRLGATHDQRKVVRQSGQIPPTSMRRHGSDGGGECPTLRRVKRGFRRRFLVFQISDVRFRIECGILD